MLNTKVALIISNIYLYFIIKLKIVLLLKKNQRNEYFSIILYFLDVVFKIFTQFL